MAVFKKCQAVAIRTVKSSKLNCSNNFTSTINVQTPLAVVWNKIGRISPELSPIHIKHTSNIVDPNGKIIKNSQETANILAEAFALNSRISYPAGSKSYTTPKSHPIDRESTCNLGYINSPLTFNKLLQAISKPRNSSPRPDGTPKALIKNHPHSYLEYLLVIYNHLWQSHSFPIKGEKLWVSQSLS